ncbi:PREDICTED: E3 ubiquitin-protein ligase LRSAM1-like isoform X1 [Nicrophorus vespilloides]|uniref:E3 ubiquitin-protein ligase LRSAM1-like isoform X1 n=1 Tax=Nicrophorus vespilloides TaxID=110193 RepID=A0ABM1N028_NICVS|nr:PREDICTED: E3 ubiquitin-protein ligase LRSAM1-like isoform X1 [Nicrophorus vespilloides]
MFRWGKKENKAKLEHKLYLARENPEPVFDISDCSVNNVPSGIYSLCRVFLKEQLNMSFNNLTSLSGGGNLRDLHILQVLSLNNNAFTHLPEEIQLLTNLKELYIQNNQIKKLPSTICQLLNLIVLNVSNNLLTELPRETGNLNKLRLLDLQGNKKLKELPRSFGKLQHLRQLYFDADGFQYPPKDIAEQGVDVVVKYVCDDNNYEYSPTDDTDACITEEYVPYSNIEAKIWEIEKIKEQKKEEFLAIEKHNEIMMQQEFELANSMKINKVKLLDDIRLQQNQLDESLDKIQQVKDIERFKLIEQLQEVEMNSDIAINNLLQMTKEPLGLLLEQERIEQEKLIEAANKYNDNLCKTEILDAMEEILKQETVKFMQFDEYRCETSRSILEQEMKSDSRLGDLLHSQDTKSQELSQKLLEDSVLQRVAVAALLERSDARSWSLVQQVKLIESQLASLTVIEMKRRKLELNHQLNDLAEKRINLSILLMDLLEQQGVRRSQLLETLQSLEDKKEQAEDFWLIQYQQLLDRMPDSIAEFQRKLNPSLIEALNIAGCIHYLPLLAKWSTSEDKLVHVTEEELKNIGISSAADRQNILRAFENFRTVQLVYPELLIPTAPTLQTSEASAPPVETTQCFSTTECVVCLDNKCEIIYVPCGHFCCCTDCSLPLNECPMCRAAIEKKIRVD